MKHYFVGCICNGVAQLVGDDESVLTVDLGALPARVQEGDEVRLDGGVFVKCPESEARRADIFRSAFSALAPDSNTED